jgi:hypothetical protein
LWRHDEGSVIIWQMDGSQVASSQGLGGVPTPWQVEDTGDFNGDGKSDILWRHDEGSIVIWQMEGFQVASSQGLGGVPTQWEIQA